MNEELVYDRKIEDDFSRLGKEHQKVLEWVGTKKDVLEVACHTGYVSSWLKKQHCRVTGVELVRPALEKAMPFLDRAIAGNIEDEQIWKEIASDKYDVVLYMHILEHLVDAESILKGTKEILRPGGKVVICLPNISNWANRWEIFKGDFNYTETGVMDKTHLHFYNYHTAVNLIERCGFKVDQYYGRSWQVYFKFLPQVFLLKELNSLYNKMVRSFSSRNMTDKVLMFLVS